MSKQGEASKEVYEELIAELRELGKKYEDRAKAALAEDIIHAIGLGNIFGSVLGGK